MGHDDDDELPDPHSPTRRPRFGGGMPDPFKSAAGGQGRPPMSRQRTVPVRAPVPQPALFGTQGGMPPGGRIPRSRSPTSPQRRRPLTKAVTAGEDMLRAVQTRNMNGMFGGNPPPAQSVVGGRTLVELQQARAGMDPSRGAAKRMLAPGIENEVACWDAERDEDMPSPFLSRTRKSIVMR
jgi:hypothetical protein